MWARARTMAERTWCACSSLKIPRSIERNRALAPYAACWRHAFKRSAESASKRRFPLTTSTKDTGSKNAAAGNRSISVSIRRIDSTRQRVLGYRTAIPRRNSFIGPARPVASCSVRDHSCRQTIVETRLRPITLVCPTLALSGRRERMRASGPLQRVLGLLLLAHDGPPLLGHTLMTPRITPNTPSATLTRPSHTATRTTICGCCIQARILPHHESATVTSSTYSCCV